MVAVLQVLSHRDLKERRSGAIAKSSVRAGKANF